MRSIIPLIRASVPSILALAFATALARAQEPGASVAAPRFAVAIVDDGIIFKPGSIRVEQGDWVRWKSVATFLSHTTTSGTDCLGGGQLWDFSLTSGTQFTRQFSDPPSTIPFFCRPHCSLGMQGSVTVTTLIQVSAADSQGSLVLSWQGGGGLYRVFRSDSPAFCILSAGYPACTASTVQTFAPDLGDSGTTFTDATQPGAGQVSYYLVMSKF